MAMNFMFSKDTFQELVIHSKNDTIEIKIDEETEKITEGLL